MESNITFNSLVPRPESSPKCYIKVILYITAGKKQNKTKLGVSDLKLQLRHFKAQPSPVHDLGAPSFLSCKRRLSLPLSGLCRGADSHTKDLAQQNHSANARSHPPSAGSLVSLMTVTEPCSLNWQEGVPVADARPWSHQVPQENPAPPSQLRLLGGLGPA